jgi:thiamine kinase-like enzyme
MENSVLVQLRRIPRFAKSRAEAFRVHALEGGQHNTLFLVEYDGERFVYRLGRRVGDHPNHYEDEAHNARAAARSGVAPEILHFDCDDGSLLYRYIVGRTMDNDRFKDREAVKRAARALRALHAGSLFRSNHTLYTRLDRNRSAIAALSGGLYGALPRIAEAVDRLRRILDAAPVPWMPCHNDPIPENYIDNGTRIQIVDWQCAAMADPHWELGGLAAQAGFKSEQDQALIETYFDRPDDSGVSRVALYKVIVSFYWAVHHLARLAAGEDSERREKGALAWYRHCERLLGAADLGRHVERVTRLAR